MRKPSRSKLKLLAKRWAVMNARRQATEERLFALAALKGELLVREFKRRQRQQRGGNGHGH